MGGLVVISGLKSITNYFPKNVLESLSKDLKGQKFRLHIINKKSSRELLMICSVRDIVRLDKNNKEVYSLKDTETQVYSGSLECGSYFIKTIIDGSDYKGTILDYERVNPLIGWENVILLKKGVVSDLYKNYFNHKFINVYAIV